MKETTNITEAEYQDIKARYDNHYDEMRRLYPGKCSFTPEEQATLPPCPTHDEVSSMEVYEFRHDLAERYFAYVHETEYVISPLNAPKVTRRYPTHITTWTGEILGVITGRGHPYRSNMGDERINITVKMINGRVYHGTFFKSSGDYCRLKLSKRS